MLQVNQRIIFPILGVLMCGCHPESKLHDSRGINTQAVVAESAWSRTKSVDALLAKLSLDDKISLVSGIGFAMTAEQAQAQAVPGAAGYTFPVPSLGIKSIVLADGPAGVRILPERDGDDRRFHATAFPIETVLSSSWDTALLENVGRAYGHEVKEYGIDILLAPGMNIHRDPRGGRNFEYYSEDPLLSGRMAAAMVRGVQEMGVGATPKHYVANNQETNRYNVDTVVSERALREIYLRGFQIMLQESDPWAIMSAYNRVNQVPASQSEALLTTVLRDEWRFRGVVMTDWFAGMDNTVAQMNAGNELLMPGMPETAAQLKAGLASGELSIDQLDRNVRYILDVMVRTPSWVGYINSNEPDLEANAVLARKAASDGIVLLKNEEQTLPLAADARQLAVFGVNSYEFISGGTGSGDVHEAYTISLVDGLEARDFVVDDVVRRQYESYLAQYHAENPKSDRFWEPTPPPPEFSLSNSLVEEKAQSADIAVITIGRNSGEFQDRPVDGDFYLSEAELSMIRDVSTAFRAQRKAVVAILNIGNVIEVDSWRDLVDAIVLPWQGGQESGNAVVDVLIGDVNPSGKLPTTFPLTYEDAPTAENFPGERLSDVTTKILGLFDTFESRVLYEEGIYVGYRFYDKANVDVAYPFGFGLSYTQFAYGDLKSERLGDDSNIQLEIEVTNQGSIPGREVVQLYVSAPKDSLHKPVRELRGFSKTRLLKPGESETLSFTIPVNRLASFYPDRRAWIAPAGEYEIHAAASSRDLRSTSIITLSQELITEKVLADLKPNQNLEEMSL